MLVPLELGPAGPCRSEPHGPALRMPRGTAAPCPGARGEPCLGWRGFPPVLRAERWRSASISSCPGCCAPGAVSHKQSNPFRQAFTCGWSFNYFSLRPPKNTPSGQKIISSILNARVKLMPTASNVRARAQCTAPSARLLLTALSQHCCWGWPIPWRSFGIFCLLPPQRWRKEKRGCSSGVPPWKAGTNGTKQCSSTEVRVLRWLTASGRAQPTQRSSRVHSNGTKRPFSSYLGLSDGGTPSWFRLRGSSVWALWASQGNVSPLPWLSG